MPNTRELGKERELEMLRGLANLGLMSTRQLARWVYNPRTEAEEHAAVNKATRVITRLKRDELVIERKASAGHTLWALGKVGTARLNARLVEEGFEPWAKDGGDLGTNNWLRQSHVIDYLTQKAHEGFAVVGRPGIRAGLVDQKYGPCDGVIAQNQEGGFYIRGVVYVHDLGDSTLDRVRALLQVIDVKLIGSPRLTARVLKEVGQ